MLVEPQRHAFLWVNRWDGHHNGSVANIVHLARERHSDSDLRLYRTTHVNGFEQCVERKPLPLVLLTLEWCGLRLQEFFPHWDTVNFQLRGQVSIPAQFYEHAVICQVEHTVTDRQLTSEGIFGRIVKNLESWRQTI